MFESRVVVFREIKLFDQTLFQWFRVGNVDEDHIVPDLLLTPEDHWELLEAD
jgi:hypothetical protein